MAVVDSLSSSPSQRVINNIDGIHNTTQILNEQTKLSSEECNNDMLSVSYDIISNKKFNASINNNVTMNDKKSSCLSKRYTVPYGPINVRVIRCIVPTLETGRRSKFLLLDGEEAIKRELRRKKNREVARKLKEKRAHIERQLENEITELEFKEKDLLKQINNLQSYKQSLEQKYTSEMNRTLPNVECHRGQIKQTVSIHREQRQIKTEPRSPSPPWQLFFSI